MEDSENYDMYHITYDESENDNTITIRDKGTKSGDISNLFEKGEVFRKRKMYKEAIELYDTILSRNPEDYQIIALKGLCMGYASYEEQRFDFSFLSKLKNHEKESIKCIQKALDINPDYIEGWCYKSTIFIKFKKYKSALESLNKLLSINPHFERGLENKAKILELLTRYQDANDTYITLIALHPDYIGYKLLKARNLFKLKEYQSTINLITEIVRLSVNINITGIARFIQAKALYKMGKEEDAIALGLEVYNHIAPYVVTFTLTDGRDRNVNNWKGIDDWNKARVEVIEALNSDYYLDNLDFLFGGYNEDWGKTKLPI